MIHLSMRPVLIGILAGSLAACAVRVQPTLVPPTNPPETPQAAAPIPPASPTANAVQAADTPPLPTSDPTPSPAANPHPYSQYSLTAELDYAQHHLSVQEQIGYTNNTAEPIRDLLLIVEPSRYPGTFRLKKLAWGDGQPVANYTQDIGQLSIPLEQPLLPGESRQLSLDYELNLPSPDPGYYGRPVPFGSSERQTNLVDWYPFLPPYVPGQGWLVHQGSLWGEFLVYEAADFQVNLRLKDSRQDLVIAASAPAEQDGDWYMYRQEAARNFVWSISDQYQVSTTQVGPVTVTSYAFPAHAEAGRSALQTTAEALAVYNNLYGPYPRPSLAVVEADFLDGMEYDGLYFLSKGFYNLYSGTPAEYLTAIAAHETAHQWWYAQVGNDQALEPWLDEALCTYSEHLYYENTHPEALDWWWAYRVNYYEPKGWVDGSVYNPEGYRAYRDAIYLNGALFLEDLRKTIGDQAFFAFLPGYAERYTGQIATGDDFFRLLGEHTQVDLSPLLDKYFYNR